MNLINANGIVSVNVGLQRREDFDGNSAYAYTLGISSSPALGLVCDVSSSQYPYQYPCHLSLFIQIPTFYRTTLKAQKAMGWLVSL